MGRERFRQLRVWRQSIRLAEFVYRTTQRFPVEERGGLVISMRRAAAMIPSRIADGCERDAIEDYQRAVSDAQATLRELQTFATIARRMRFMGLIRTYFMRRGMSRIEAMLETLGLSLAGRQQTLKLSRPDGKPTIRFRRAA